MDAALFLIAGSIVVAGGLYFVARNRGANGKGKKKIIALIDEALNADSLDKLKEKAEELREAINGNSLGRDIKVRFNEILLSIRNLEGEDYRTGAERLKAELRELKRRIEEW